MKEERLNSQEKKVSDPPRAETTKHLTVVLGQLIISMKTMIIIPYAILHSNSFLPMGNSGSITVILVIREAVDSRQSKQ